ncbi:MAG: hypothetical protein JNL01_04075 [Bdellovibrionales bacterium]|nr:hypothetical protein [Bdellovibrionales bacterium]
MVDLSCDWKLFQNFFQPKSGTGVPVHAERGTSKPIYVVFDGTEQVVLTAFTEGEDLSEWMGRPIQELRSHWLARDIVAFDRNEVDEMIQSATSSTRFYDQIEEMRSRSRSVLRAGDSRAAFVLGNARVNRKHFLLRSIEGWWSRVLPDQFGLLLRLTGHHAGESQDFFLVVRRGKFDCFHEPDLSGMSLERRRDCAQVAKFLEDRYLVKVQTVSVPSSEWKEWARDADPWERVLQSVKSKRTRLYPDVMGVRSLIRLKAILPV